MNKLLSIAVVLMLIATGCKDCCTLYDRGVSKSLAELRKTNIENVNYNLFFSVPKNKEDDINANMHLSFDYKTDERSLILDFMESKESIHSVKVNGKSIDYKFENEHIIIPSCDIKKGANDVEIAFTAGNMSLNRNDEFLYTLLVPDRARTLFPCFDQPDIKANYSVSIEVPKGWVAIANGSPDKTEEKDNSKIFYFNKTKKLSTYLFSFTAGKFEQIDREINGRTISLFHRETDIEKVKRNTDIIFNQVGESIKWLEEYTGIDYPFACYNIVAIPSFQYGGMEHPGNTNYRSSLLFLEENASQEQKLNRANLLAHETAHMWFGDMVTMKWFNDVWLKEVFANFYADKMVNPMYPEINHQLNFMMGHYPAAYKIDRSKGANPIIQKLPNLNEAGTLYGNIIYHKSPVVMTMLEQIMGEKMLKKGIREYLNKYAYSNAVWDDLVNILDKYTDTDLKKWSNVWVKEPGLPEVSYQKAEKDGKKGVLFTQKDPAKKGRLWPQTFEYGIVDKSGKISYKKCELDKKDSFVETGDYEYIIPNTSGGYGYFKTDSKTVDYIMSEFGNIENPVRRGMIIINLYEELVRDNIAPDAYISFLTNVLNSEKENHIISRALSHYGRTYWSFLNREERKELSPKAEKLFMNLIEKTEDKSLKRQFYGMYSNIASSKEAVQLFKDLWAKNKNIEGITLYENDYIGLSYALALRAVDGYEDILREQRRRINNPDRLAKFEFILPALSSRQEVRDAFFENLKDPKNREHEVWVQSALYMLHHPLRNGVSEKYLKPSLEMLKEIQETGDIFFPGGWLAASLSSYTSESAAEVVTEFLKAHPDYYKSLRLKILQESDMLLRRSGYIDKL